MTARGRSMSIGLILSLVLVGFPAGAQSHCDTLTGAVVRSARVAVDRNDVTALLVWVTEPQEPELREAFEKTMRVRRLNASAQELADRYFFETVVRLYLAGMGEPFTGLNDAVGGGDILDSGEEAIESGVIDYVVKRVTDRVAAGIRERFARAMAAQESADGDVTARRRYAHTYMEFMRYIEAVGDPSHVCEPSAAGTVLPRR